MDGRGARPRSNRAALRPLRRLPLGSLRVFVSVAGHLSFTRAADALGVTASAASLQIRALEEYLGQRLFRRIGRQVHLTNEGTPLPTWSTSFRRTFTWRFDSAWAIGRTSGPKRFWTSGRCRYARRPCSQAR